MRIFTLNNQIKIQCNECTYIIVTELETSRSSVTETKNILWLLWSKQITHLTCVQFFNPFILNWFLGTSIINESHNSYQKPAVVFTHKGRLRNHNVIDDGNVHFRSFKKTYIQSLENKYKVVNLQVQKLLNYIIWLWIDIHPPMNSSLHTRKT